MPRYTYSHTLADKFEYSSLFNLVPEVDPTTEDFSNGFMVLVYVNSQSFKRIVQCSGRYKLDRYDTILKNRQSQS